MRFDLSTASYRLSAEGIEQRIVPSSWNGCAVAEAVKEVLAASDLKERHRPVVGVIPFDSARSAHLYAPRAVTWADGRATRSQPARVAPSTRYSPAVASPHYRAAVIEALRRIHVGPLEKVVLARQVTAIAERPISTDLVFDRLIERDPQAYAYRVDLPGGTEAEGVLLGASPELVLSVRDRQIESWPLAGSAPRSPDPVADQAEATALLASEKDRAEHAYVTTAIAQVLAEHADNVCVPCEPELVMTPNLWHLGTRITGTLRDGTTSLELAYAMHPTPAVSGWPIPLAQQTIAELEDFDRGWYAGIIGWVDTEGNGDWALVLRGGVIRGHVATLYAGAGIVAGSDPDREHAEVDAKLQTFAAALDSVLVLR